MLVCKAPTFEKLNSRVQCHLYPFFIT